MSRRAHVRHVSSPAAQGTKPRALAPKLSWSDAASLFLAEERLKGRRLRTLTLHREVLAATRADLDALDAPAEPAQLRREHIAALVTRLQEVGRQPRTINLRLQTLHQWFAFLVARGECAEDPVATVPAQRESRRMPRALDDAQVERLLQVIDRSSFVGLRDYTMVVLLLDTGMRLSEIIQLEIDDLDLREGQIKLQHRLKDHEERITYLSQPAVGALRAYLRERGDLPTTRVFVSRDERELSAASLQSRLQAYSHDIGVVVSPHRLRHTFARAYVLNGGDPFSLMQILGHADMTTVRWYVQLWGRDVQKQHGKFTALRRYKL